MTKIPNEVEVYYKSIGGSHFFKSDDNSSPRFTVVNNDINTAFRLVGLTLTELIRIDHNVDIKFTPEKQLAEFDSFQKSSISPIKWLGELK